MNQFFIASTPLLFLIHPLSTRHYTKNNYVKDNNIFFLSFFLSLFLSFFLSFFLSSFLSFFIYIVFYEQKNLSSSSRAIRRFLLMVKILSDIFFKLRAIFLWLVSFLQLQTFLCKIYIFFPKKLKIKNEKNFVQKFMKYWNSWNHCLPLHQSIIVIRINKIFFLLVQ
jgi:hypothetical protein